MTEEQKATLRKTSHTGYIVSDSKGIGLMAALEQAGEGQHVYERFQQHCSVGLDHNERMLAMLKRLLAVEPRGTGLRRDLCRLVEEVDAYNAAQLEVIGPYFGRFVR